MAKIKGAWVFNNILQAPTETIQESINFTVTTTPPSLGTEFLLTCNEIVITPAPDLGYYIVSSSADLSVSGITLPANAYVYSVNGWYPDFGDGTKVITFPSEQTVSDYFYSWFIENAKPIFAIIEYNGKSTVLTEKQTATLRCAEKKAITDIIVAFNNNGCITYNNKKTIIEYGETAILPCAEKKLLTDIVIFTNIPDVSLGLVSSDGYILVSNDDFILSPLDI